MKKIIKKIYNAIPFKPAFYGCLKEIIKLPPSIYQHLHFKGVFEVHVFSQKKFKIYHHGGIEENEIFWNGLENGWEKKSISLWIELVKIHSTVLDIGANTGLYALIAQTLNPQAKLHAFEPIPSVFNILQKNVALNNYTIKNHEVALSDYNGTAKIFMPIDSDFAYSVTVNKNRLNEKTKVKELNVKTQTLKSFIEENNIESIDLMKIDVETHEPEVLIGMGEYLKKFKPTIIIEVLDNEIAEKLNHIVEGLGYLYFNIDDQKNSIRQVSKIEKSDYWNFLLCNETVAKELKLI